MREEGREVGWHPVRSCTRSFGVSAVSPRFPMSPFRCTAIFGRLYHEMLAGCSARSIGELQLKMRFEMHGRPKRATDGGRASVPLCADVPNLFILIWWLTFL